MESQEKDLAAFRAELALSVGESSENVESVRVELLRLTAAKTERETRAKECAEAQRQCKARTAGYSSTTSRFGASARSFLAGALASIRKDAGSLCDVRRACAPCGLCARQLFSAARAHGRCGHRSCKLACFIALLDGHSVRHGRRKNSTRRMLASPLHWQADATEV